MTFLEAMTLAPPPPIAPQLLPSSSFSPYHACTPNRGLNLAAQLMRNSVQVAEFLASALVGAEAVPANRAPKQV